MNKINVFDFLPVTFCLSLSDPNFDNHQNHFLKFFELNLPEALKPNSKKHWLTLPRRRLSNSPERKVSYFYSKPELKETYVSDNSQFLWILKPSYHNQVRDRILRDTAFTSLTIFKLCRI